MRIEAQAPGFDTWIVRGREPGRLHVSDNEGKNSPQISIIQTQSSDSKLVIFK